MFIMIHDMTIVMMYADCVCCQMKTLIRSVQVELAELKRRRRFELAEKKKDWI